MTLRTRLPIVIALLAIFGVLTYWAYDAAQLYVFQEGWSGSSKNDLLFGTAVLAIPISSLLGILLGSLKYNKSKDKVVNGKIERHDELMFLQHWSNALGVVVLIITGISLGTLFIPRLITGTENIGFALNLHFVGVLFFFFGVSYFVTLGLFTGEIKKMMPQKGDLQKMIDHYMAMFTKKESPKEKKFLAAERVVFPFWIIGVLGIAITGIVKTLAHVWSLPAGLMGVMTFLHGIFAIYMAVMLVAHIFAAALIPPSWPLLGSMITGNVSEKYVKENHELWYEEIKNNENVHEQLSTKKSKKRKDISTANM